jgi:hypothetical protein
MHAVPKNYEQQLRADCEEIVAQGWLNFLVPWGPGKVTVRADEVATALGYETVQSVYNELDRATTWLEAERRVGTERQEVRFTTRSVMLQMAREAMEGGMFGMKAGRVQPPLFMERVKSLLTAMTRTQIAELREECERFLKSVSGSSGALAKGAR